MCAGLGPALYNAYLQWVVPAGPRRRATRARLMFFSSRRRHTRLQGDWSSDVCSSDLGDAEGGTPSAGLVGEADGALPPGTGDADGGAPPAPVGTGEADGPPDPGGTGGIGRGACRERG